MALLITSLAGKVPTVTFSVAAVDASAAHKLYTLSYTSTLERIPSPVNRGFERTSKREVPNPRAPWRETFHTAT